MKPNQNDIYTRLAKIYKEFSGYLKVDSYSQMCEFWKDPTVEILVDSDELNALEIEFGIEFDDDTAMDLYEMTLMEAAVLIANMIHEQNLNNSTLYSEMIIESLTPQEAKMILFDLWRNNYKFRKDISIMIEKLEK